MFAVYISLLIVETCNCIACIYNKRLLHKAHYQNSLHTSLSDICALPYVTIHTFHVGWPLKQICVCDFNAMGVLLSAMVLVHVHVILKL